jgi:hypothetical protein
VKKSNIDILVVVLIATTVIFIIKGLLAFFWQDVPFLGYVYLGMAGFFGLGLIWSVVHSFIKK